MRRHLLAASFASLFGLVIAYCGQAFLAGAAATVVPACSNADAALFTPPTGIDIQVDSLTAGRGCGTGPGQIYKYAAYVEIPIDSDAGYPLGTDDAGQPRLYVTWGVYDCFTDAIFTTLCTYNKVDAFDNAFSVKVYAFNADDWNANGIGAAISGPLPPAATYDPTGMCVPGLLQSVAALPADALLHSTWATTCTATQQSNVSVLANCAPLASGTVPL